MLNNCFFCLLLVGFASSEVTAPKANHCSQWLYFEHTDYTNQLYTALTGLQGRKREKENRANHTSSVALFSTTDALAKHTDAGAAALSGCAVSEDLETTVLTQFPLANPYRALTGFLLPAPSC